MTELSPIVLFVYNRPIHTEKTLEALSKNELAIESTLYIYADGPKENVTAEELAKLQQTRDIIKKYDKCKDVLIVESEKNKGLANSIVSGVTEVLNKHGKVIVLEDDILTSPGFLTYMNQALNLYEEVDDVFHIAAHIHPIPFILPDLFFYNVNSCWGWGTWKRAWNHFVWDIESLNRSLELHPFYTIANFNKGQGNAFSEQLQANLTGELNTWAVRWHASMFLKNGLCLHTGKSLVRNIGFDASGVHCGVDEKYLKQKIVDNIKVKLIPLKESNYVVECMMKFSLASKDGSSSKIRIKILFENIKTFLNKVVP
jgi:hypothetical protein